MKKRLARGLAFLSAATAVPIFALATDTARADAPPHRYMDLTPVCGSTCVKDSMTGLVWQQADVAVAYSYIDARKDCLAPWRLPTIRELLTLVDETRKIAPTIDPQFSSASQCEWSVSRVATSATEAYWAVDFANGGTIKVDPIIVDGTKGCAVRCVQ